ncbi:MMPL family transporter [Microlunatus parietis]|uniref:RND superfamily putative drug exporter n=1 Tax=Microlunatus parietis TaxID=682979 RepID=A0A7Y9I4U4_9ACTN|nr:MMPL family transporter [Microlunatus parietis]NYE70030.1 RND superfamily putative drug exporter [Microlunatus parietis]
MATPTRTSPDRPGALTRWAGLVAGHARLTLAAAVAATVLLGVAAAGALGALTLSLWEAPGTESVRAQEVLVGEFDTNSANLVLLVTARDGTVDDPGVSRAATDVAAELGAVPGIRDVWSYWSTGGDPTLRSEDGGRAVILAWLDGDPTETRQRLSETIIPGFTRELPAIGVEVAGGEAISAQIGDQARADFLRAELIIVPLLLVLLIIVFRRVVPALATLAVGLFSIIGTLAALRGLAMITEVSTFAANITLVMGLALGVDYSLFLIARFREELAAGAEIRTAVIDTVRSAGRTVLFSGLTVAASVAVLMLFPYAFLRSFGYAGVLVVASALVGTLVILPATMIIFGPRFARRGGRSAPVERGFWYRTGERVMQRPIRYGLAALALVGLLAAPALGFRPGPPDDRILSADVSSARAAYDTMRAEFVAEPQDALAVVLPALPESPDRDAAIDGYARDLSRVDGIVRVNAVTGSYIGGERIAGPAADSGRYASAGSAWIAAIPAQAALERSSSDLVAAVRAVPAPASVLVGGFPAELVDFETVLAQWVPPLAALIIAVTFVILFLMSGSLLIPVKATVLNLLSLAVMAGVIVVGFQDGALAGLLGFTPTGDVNLTFPILMFCIVYGLSMDYEVFLIARIREEYERTGDTRRSVLVGLQRSGPLVSTAAAILALTFLLYATAEVSYLQLIGVGTAVAIIVDATLLRAVLLPASMRLAGRANWWLPRFLRPVHARFGLDESVPEKRGSAAIVHPELRP